MVEMVEGSELKCSPPLLLLVLWAPQSQAPGLWRPHPFQRKKAGLLARPPMRKLLHAHNGGQAQALKALHDDGLPSMDALEHGVKHLRSENKIY